MLTILTILHVLISIFLIISILLQSSKGGGLAGMFGGGGMGAFGGRGTATFLAKITMWLGIGFASTAILIGLIRKGTKYEQRSMVQQVMEGEQERTSTPATILPEAAGSKENEDLEEKPEGEEQ